MIERILKEDELIALRFDNRKSEPGTHPLTDPLWSLQALMMRRPAGHVFSKHTHATMDRSTMTLQEAIVVTEGEVRIEVCTRSGETVGTYNVTAGQCLYLVNGGYEITVTKDAAFYEFKNGPYFEDKVNL